jgi:nucleotide-binding universal stress UspA family protein
MNQVLVAVDGSEHSFKVIDAASEIARGLSAEILLVYVIQLQNEEPVGIKEYEKAEQYPDAYADYLQDLAERAVSKFSEAVRKTGIPFRSITPTGNPAAEILNVAEVEKPKLIILGVKGLHGLARFRSMGSVARNVVENSHVPVLCVPLVPPKP